eukprot:1153937-Pelagomonas_calceolata.AAC.1
MEARPAPRGPLLKPLKRILLAILWSSVTIFDTLKAYKGHCLATHTGDIVSLGVLMCLHGSGQLPQRQDMALEVLTVDFWMGPRRGYLGNSTIDNLELELSRSSATGTFLLQISCPCRQGASGRGGCWARQEKESPGVPEHGEQPSRS